MHTINEITLEIAIEWNKNKIRQVSEWVSEEQLCEINDEIIRLLPTMGDIKSMG